METLTWENEPHLQNLMIYSNFLGGNISSPFARRLGFLHCLIKVSFRVIDHFILYHWSHSLNVLPQHHTVHPNDTNNAILCIQCYNYHESVNVRAFVLDLIWWDIFVITSLIVIMTRQFSCCHIEEGDMQILVYKHWLQWGMEYSFKIKHGRSILDMS